MADIIDLGSTAENEGKRKAKKSSRPAKNKADNLGPCAGGIAAGQSASLHVFGSQGVIWSFGYADMGCMRCGGDWFQVEVYERRIWFRLTVDGEKLWPIYRQLAERRLEWMMVHEPGNAGTDTPVISRIKIDRQCMYDFFEDKNPIVAVADT